MSDTLLPVYTVYVNPTDFPGQYVVRRFLVEANDPRPDGDPLYVGTSLDDAREAIPPGLYCFLASDGDDPSILESWM